MMKQVRISLSFLLIIFLTACLYPEERKMQNQIPYEDQLQAVQTAVDNYVNDHQVLPIMNRDIDTPIYQKYPVDFNKLIPRYIQEPPGNAYENGGVYQYVLVDVEEKPTVKLIDLRIVEAVRDYQFEINRYRREHKYLPFEKVLNKELFQLNHEALGYESIPQVRSPITGNNLPFIVNGQGEIFVDYSQDLYQLLQKYGDKYDFKEGDDIRQILVDHSPFVPVFSVPYTIKNGEPVFLSTENEK